MATAICFSGAAQSLSVGNAKMSDLSRQDVPANGCWCLASQSRGTAAPSVEWLENEFSFSFFLNLVPDGLISHFTTSQEVLCLDAALAIKRGVWPANV